MNSKTTHCGVGLLAADMQVMATFYRDVLGLEPIGTAETSRSGFDCPPLPTWTRNTKN